MILFYVMVDVLIVAYYEEHLHPAADKHSISNFGGSKQQDGVKALDVHYIWPGYCDPEEHL
jgi:hypothetical protein